MGTWEKSISLPRAGMVSNPLGWDGDINEKLVKIRTQAVSNPLGWDGDLVSRRGRRSLVWFLIH